MYQLILVIASYRKWGLLWDLFEQCKVNEILVQNNYQGNFLQLEDIDTLFFSVCFRSYVHKELRITVTCSQSLL